MSIPAHLSALFLRDLPKLRVEIEGYTNEEDIWKVPEGINNSAGNLSLHICGNLRYYIGTILGGDGYVRDREFEFNGRCDLTTLLDEIEATHKVLGTVLSAMDEGVPEKVYPIEMFGGPINTGFFLMHLYGHMNYHLGQVNYHRRLIE